MNDTTFLMEFESLAMAAGDFDHEGHLRLAWILLSREPRLAACERFVRNLKAFAGHHGAHGKYHETLTFFFLNLLADRVEATEPAPDWASFRDANPDLCGDFRALVDGHYAPETIASEFARAHFVLPDRPAATVA
ncbi:MAG: hypothetical protein AAGE01_16875 [Pseudomonadota bacterium]